MMKIKNPLIIFNENVEKIILSQIEIFINNNRVNVSETKRFLIYNLTDNEDSVKISIQKNNKHIYINNIRLADINRPYESFLIINYLVDLLGLNNFENFISERRNLETSILNLFNIMSDTMYFSILGCTSIYRINKLKTLENNKIKLCFDKADNFQIKKICGEYDNIIDAMLLSFDVFKSHKIIKIVDKSNDLKKIAEWFILMR